MGFWSLDCVELGFVGVLDVFEVVELGNVFEPAVLKDFSGCSDAIGDVGFEPGG